MLKGFALMILIACAGFADTITYTFTATASGSMDGTSFSDSLPTIIALADTSHPRMPYWSGVVVGSLSATFNSEFPYVFVNRGKCTGSPEYPTVSSCVGFGTDFDLLDIANNGFATYVRGTSVGPLTDPTPTFAGLPSLADHGIVSFTSVEDGSFTASVAPEPSSVGALCIASIAIGVVSRRRLLAGHCPK
jgi:hypothetical protein